jgi:hypothetical protein
VWSDAGASPLLIVDAESEVVEQDLRAGRLACPGCGSPVAPRGHARPRPVRVAGGVPAEVVWLRPRRARCLGCGAWHVLLPCVCLCRRRDAVEVIGRALVLAVDGLGFRPIAAELGLPESTVRGWLRRARSLAEVIRQHFTRWAFALDPVVAGGPPAGSGLMAAVEAVGRCGRAASLSLGRGSPWRLASALSAGGLLCTSCPWLQPP